VAPGRKPTDTEPLGPKSELPDKLYFKIGEVAQLVGVQTHVLRYWEKEVPFIRPGKTASNQRRYRRRDVELFREIRRLLHEERYTLAGARRRLAGGGRVAQDQPAPETSHDAAPAPPDRVESTGREGQLPLGFRRAPDDERVDRVRAGLRELIRLAGEDP
jgi:DNA-binding transcriptional MerR regulator